MTGRLPLDYAGVIVGIRILAHSLDPNVTNLAPSVGISTADAIAREVVKYAALHPDYSMLHIHTLRPGDGLTICRALGKALKAMMTPEQEDGDEGAATEFKGFALELYPSDDLKRSRLVGRHLSELSERRRSGVEMVSSDDLWVLQTFQRHGTPTPCLTWSKRPEALPTEPSHLTVAFDTFDTRIQCFPKEEALRIRPLEGFGLFPSLMRSYELRGTPTWRLTVASDTEGPKHPASRGLTDRLVRVHNAVLRSTGLHLSGSDENWPTLVSQVDSEKADSLKRLHELSDWVLTVDRNAGIEYFDAPREEPEVYETYVIDCVPERHDLDTVQLVTSTSQVDEVVCLMNKVLEELGLSRTPRHCRFLLDQLKALSGRLAMRLSQPGGAQSELIALALFYRNCVNNPAEPKWLSPRDGFFVPLDDVRDLLLPRSDQKSNDEDPEVITKPGQARADLVYVDLPRRSGLRFTFVEIKHRRLLRSVRESAFLDHIQTQVCTSRDRWTEGYFSERLTHIQGVLRRKRLARALHFYADKARRHILSRECYDRLSEAIDRIFSTVEKVDIEYQQDRGYVFCPEYPGEVELIESNGSVSVYLFGPKGLDDEDWRFSPSATAENTRTPEHPATPEHTTLIPNREPGKGGHKGVDSVPPAVSVLASTKSVITAPVAPSSSLETDVVLGLEPNSEDSVTWRLSIRGNPHLMMVGLPGMGKTGSIVNICRQLSLSGIAPIVFAYHEDIEERLCHYLPDVQPVDLQRGLGFNPMRVVGRGPHAWIDNVGMLRDIFASIFPDLGEIQTNEIREAIKQSYTEQGYGVPAIEPPRLELPAFARFYQILAQKEKPSQGVMLRLGELNDYGFFQAQGSDSSLLDKASPVVVSVFSTMNENLQRALASFILLSIYQSMFLRGERREGGMTHAVVFDEAHRASRLKLLPTMARECRKYGITLIVSSQSAKDFDIGLYSAIANYLVLRVGEADAVFLAKNVAHEEEARRLAGVFKKLPKYHAMFFSEGKHASHVHLTPPE